jgi:four helix bundle protein
VTSLGSVPDRSLRSGTGTGTGTGTSRREDDRRTTRASAGRTAGMVLDHERLDVYLIALDFLVFANEVIERLPRGRGHLADQLTRASTSIVLNLAEGAGKLSKADKRRYYLTARGSATESAALLDVCLRLRLIGEAEYRAGKAMVVRNRILENRGQSAATTTRPRRSCDCPSAADLLVAPPRAPLRLSPTAAHRVDVEPS